MKTRFVAPLGVLASLLLLGTCAAAGGGGRWSPEEVETLRSLWIGELEPLPSDPTNRFADDERAARFGQRLFFDSALSLDGRVACATCHDPAKDFQDGLPLSRGVGRTDRRAMPIAGTAHAPFLFWDGRKDSPWAQALGPLESPVEHGGSRGQYAHRVVERWSAEYEAIFGALPDLSGVPAHAGPVANPVARAAWDAMDETRREAVTGVFVNMGKAIAAYERKLGHGPSRFDRYVERLLTEGQAPEGVLTKDEEAGLRLFIGEANCTRCHNGPLFTNFEFHNTGVPAAAGLPEDLGRARGAGQALADEFNCRSRWSDAAPERCAELDYIVSDGPELVRAFKVPSLRNVAERAPYMHAGQIATLAEVIEHYDRAPGAPAGDSELERLGLKARERARLEAFLRTLSAPLAAHPSWLAAPDGR